MARGRWDMLVERVPRDRPILGAEVGVWRGAMASRVLALLPRLTYILVDRWQCPPPGDSYFQGSRIIANAPQSEFDAALERCRWSVKPHESRVHFLIGHSAKMAEHVDPQSLDFAFIDADHSYAGCLADIQAWTPRIKAGGIIGGHDWGKPEQGDVEGAVRAYFGPRGYDVEVANYSTWWVRIREPVT